MPEKMIIEQMTEQEFASEVTGALVILSTTSGDKRANYQMLMNLSGKGENHQAGVNFYFADVGAFDLPPRETDEDTGSYKGNLDGKALRFLMELRDPVTKKAIRSAVGLAGAQNVFDASSVKIVGMTEDSGWRIDFKDEAVRANFLKAVEKLLEPHLHLPEDGYILKNLSAEDGFPGANLKPIQEHLPGKFSQLMEIIYQAAAEAEMPEIRFEQTRTASFVFPHNNKSYTQSFSHKGTIISRQEYKERLAASDPSLSINSNFVQVIDGQKEPARTLDEIENDLLTKSKADFPGEFAMRKMTEWLQEIAGKRRSTTTERKKIVRVAHVEPADIFGGKPEHQSVNLPKGIRDLTTGIHVPSEEELLKYPYISVSGVADVAILLPQTDEPGHDLKSDPNLRLLVKFCVDADTDPQTMGMTIIVDNRSRKFDNALRVLAASYNGGKLPLLIATSEKELETLLRQQKEVVQRSPVITPIDLNQEEVKKEEPLPPSAPKDDRFTVFIAGGHANDSAQDIADAKSTAKFCAAKGYRIVTGGGALRGSMGAVHTGFIEYHLENMVLPSRSPFRKQLKEFKNPDGTFQTERMIKESPELIDELADNGFIPRDMFHAFSVDNLLKMEGLNGKPPPGITYQDTGNRVRRMQNLLDTDFALILPGGPGTLEEIVEALDKKLNPNNRSYDPKLELVIYNNEGRFTKILEHYGIYGDDSAAKAKRELHGITVVNGGGKIQDVQKILEEKAAVISPLEEVRGKAKKRDAKIPPQIGT